MDRLIKRGNMWYSDFRQDGKRIRRALSPYKEQAEKLLNDMLLIRSAERTGVQPKDVSWFFFQEKYLKIRRATKNPGTYDKDERAFRRVAEYGRPLSQLSQMTPEYLMGFQVELLEKKFPPSSIAEYTRRIKTAMHTAEDWKMVSPQAWGTVESESDGKRVEYFDYEELAKVLSLSSGHWRIAAMLMAYAGLRSGEVRNLEWKDVNFKEHLIEVRIKSNWRPKGSKGKKLKERKVDMLPLLETFLQNLPDRSGYVLGGTEPIKKYTYRQYFTRMTEKAKFKVYAHKFRHTYASFLISSGASLEEVGELMGQTDPRSTKIYAHMMPHARRKAVDRMQDSLPAYLLPASAFEVVQVGA